jgi:hypothetical protein
MNEHQITADPKSCSECGSPLGPGRSDRKFCNDICRTAFNNRRRNEAVAEPAATYQPDRQQQREEQDEHQIEQIQQILYENRVKLINMRGLYDSSLDPDDFYGFGLNLKFFTSEYHDKDRDLRFKMCFDHGYHIANDRVYLIYWPSAIYSI